jgi:hypothetical protein
MSRFRKHTELGFRWLTCGWRLFLRNPWLLGGMGFCAAALISALALIPFLGGLLIALVAALLLASAYLAIDNVSRQKMSLPASLRLVAVKQSPRELISVFRNEQRVFPTVVTGLYSMVAALLIGVLVRLMAGSAWAKDWTSLGFVALSGVLAAWLLALCIYFLLAWSLIYALPLAFLQQEPLVPAIGRSFKTAARHAFGLSVVLGFLLVPILVGAIASLVSAWAAHALAFLVGAVVLPITAASLYCSYRTVFPQREAATIHSR